MAKTRILNLDKLLSKFTPYDGFKVDEYYGVSLLRLKKNDRFSIKLVYDFINGNQRPSSSYEVDDLDTALELVRFLEENRKKSHVQKTQHKDDDVFDYVEEKGWGVYK